MDESEANIFKQKIIESLRLLAADYSDQKNVFPVEVNIPDEIANIYDECFSCLSLSNDDEWLNSSQLSSLEEINNVLDEMSDHCKECWSLESLKSGEEWMSARQKAGKLLDSLNVEKRPPDLFWIDYII